MQYGNIESIRVIAVAYDVIYNIEMFSNRPCSTLQLPSIQYDQYAILIKIDNV